jgi:hypothetical protein
MLLAVHENFKIVAVGFETPNTPALSVESASKHQFQEDAAIKTYTASTSSKHCLWPPRWASFIRSDMSKTICAQQGNGVALWLNTKHFSSKT